MTPKIACQLATFCYFGTKLNSLLKDCSGLSLDSSPRAMCQQLWYSFRLPICVCVRVLRRVVPFYCIVTHIQKSTQIIKTLMSFSQDEHTHVTSPQVKKPHFYHPGSFFHAHSSNYPPWVTTSCLPMPGSILPLFNFNKEIIGQILFCVWCSAERCVCEIHPHCMLL